MGYANGCTCPRCADRAEGIRSGELYYDERGALRWRASDLSGFAKTIAERQRNDEALEAYRRTLSSQRRPEVS
jgi:hypothetical protein